MKASNLKSFALGFGIAISALGLYALAATLNTFASGDVVSASKINDNFTNLNTDVAAVNAKFPVAAANVVDEPGFNRNYAFPGGLAGIPTTAGAITNVTLEAPAAGFAIVTATFQFVVQHTNGTQDIGSFKLSKTAGDVDASTDPIAAVSIPASYPTTAAQEVVIPVTITNTFTVVKGTNTFNLNGLASHNGLLINRINLTTLYVPTRYGTGSAVN
jgi:hypothetical protein